MEIKALSFCLDCDVHCNGRSCERDCYPMAEEMFGERCCPGRMDEYMNFMEKVSSRLKEAADAVHDYSDIDIDAFIDILNNVANE